LGIGKTPHLPHKQGFNFWG